ncbi:phosphomannomutase [Allocatelliglobosispora scoriae]|uniref:Phosphomannomutase n=1 Tax=Allocatelliglobosispora scoriae TaxID=643052 RepID=A0A841BUG5_9ACTN|nr:phospho-sugar mutase [Allocatelliglobosispora scoriae]MBB5870400.1 phosphomannomutase [Allocatelliglobosispora scoriae]
MTDAADPAALADRVRAWIDDDPDQQSRDELAGLLEKLPDTAGELADRFAGPLTFGTAGLRGPLRAGPNGMNLAVVRQAAAGLVGWLTARDATGPLIIGYDARRGSAQFAAETAKVATGAGLRALVLPRHLPTPLLAFAVKHLGGCAGVMVTASHNPPQDNGYKVYLGEQFGGALGAGAQIVPPVDAEIAALIAGVTRLREVRLGPDGDLLDESIVDAYIESVARVVDADEPKELTIAYTPMHGVGGEVTSRAFVRAGFAEPAVVARQSAPDGTFPTVAFPNPEEPGAMDLVMALADEVGADIAIANDPDADRCAVAVPTAKGWRMLRGDEVGVLLADHLMRRGVHGTYATTIVSSSLLKRIAAARGVGYGETLTGFKWIVRAAEDLVYGYEEALGYCVDPGQVRDKDGISAALLIAELAAGLKTELRTLADRLDELAITYGLHATDQLSVRVEDLSEITAAMARLRAKTPKTLLDEPVLAVEDLLPDSDVIILRTADARVVVRPSGTEPKLKAYLEVVEGVAEGDVAAARERAAATLTALRTETAAALGIWSVNP